MERILIPKPGVLATLLYCLPSCMNEMLTRRRELGRGYWAGGSACAEHKGGREVEAYEEVKGEQGDWSGLCGESVR